MGFTPQIYNKTVIQKTLREYNLQFHTLFVAKPHVFLGNTNPLAKKKILTLEDLEPYPRLSYEQGEHNAFYFAEEILSTRHCDKDIMVSDRATLFNLLIALDGYTLCSGIINKDLNGENIITRPLDVDDDMTIGYIDTKHSTSSILTSSFIELLQEYTDETKHDLYDILS